MPSWSNGNDAGLRNLRSGFDSLRGHASGCSAVWSARRVRDAEAAGSSPASPTPGGASRRGDGTPFEAGRAQALAVRLRPPPHPGRRPAGRGAPSEAVYSVTSAGRVRIPRLPPCVDRRTTFPPVAQRTEHPGPNGTVARSIRARRTSPLAPDGTGSWLLPRIDGVRVLGAALRGRGVRSSSRLS
jgi:hypothetical protein